MARPRVYVNEYGKPVKTNTGVSYNKVRHRFYIIREGGKRQEFKTWQEARAAYQGQQAPGRKMVAVEDTQPLGEILPRIRFGPIPDPELPPGPKLPPDWKPKRYKYYAEDDILGYVKQQLQEDKAGLAERTGVPGLARLDARGLPPGGPRLSHVISEWEKAKLNGNGKAITPHITETKRLWGQFVKQVGNVHVQTLCPAHFRAFEDWLRKEGAKYSGRWQNTRVKAVKTVLKFVRRRFPDWPWPEGVLEWADGLEMQSYKAKQSNRAPIVTDHLRTGQ